MSVITVSALSADSETKDNLLHELNFLSREGIHVKFAEKTFGKFFFLNCFIDEEKDQTVIEAHEKILRYYLANIVTDLLLNGITKESMNRIIRNKYRFLAKSELGTVIQNAYSYLNNLYDDGDIEKTLSRHNQVLTKVNDYLRANSDLFLEGFLRFRLKDYFQELEESLEKAVDSFLVEREYLEFIRLLRYFVEIQEPRIDEVHVLIQSKQDFYLLDEAKHPINPEQLQGVLAELNQDVDYEDLLLSALITISPRRIILHINSNIEIVETILNVFRERVIICQGCESCTGEAGMILKQDLLVKPWNE